MFSEFHISERGSGDRKRQEALSSQIGIRTVASNDTFNYDAFGEFGLKTQYAALVPAQAESGTTDIAASDTGQMPLQTAAATVAADTLTRPG